MNNTLTHGLDLLMYLACSPSSHGVTELASALGLPKSHIHRLLQTLVESGYVEQDKNRKYAIGIGALRLGQALLAQLPLRQTAMPLMRQLAQELGLAVTLAMPFGQQAIAVGHVSHDGKIRPNTESLGSTLNAHASASGKFFLAHRNAQERDAILKQLEYSAIGPNTHKNASSLKKDLVAIKKQGYSVNNLENSPNTISLAVGIFSKDGRLLACLGVAGTSKSIPKKRQQSLVKILKANASQIATN